MATTKKTTNTKKVTAKGAEKTSVTVKTEAPVYSVEGKQVSTIALPPEIFAAKWRPDLVHQVVTAMQANARQNRAHTKDRSEVAGGGKKPWKQKGTGQARHGSSRSPIWRHGGVTFGPRAERDYHEKINKKMRNGALVSAIARKAQDGEVVFVDSFSLAAPKTAAAKKMLEALAKGAEMPMLVAKKKNAALVALSSYDANAIKSFRNIGNVETEEVRSLNPAAVLTHKYLIIEKPEAAFKALLSRTNT